MKHMNLLIFLLVLLVAQFASAFDGKVVSQDGSPVAGAKVTIDLDSVEQFNTRSDDNGRFELPSEAFLQAMIQVKGPDGKEFASVNLPVSLFESGGVTIVLQPKK